MIALLLALGAPAAAQVSVRPEEAVPAIAALLAASGVAVPRSAAWPASTCVLDKGSGRPVHTVGALVARQLAEFQSGRNTLSGACDVRRACRVEIAHADGEDVSATEIRFRLKAGRLDPSSLLCAVTP